MDLVTFGKFNIIRKQFNFTPCLVSLEMNRFICVIPCDSIAMQNSVSVWLIIIQRKCYASFYDKKRKCCVLKSSSLDKICISFIS